MNDSIGYSMCRVDCRISDIVISKPH